MRDQVLVWIILAMASLPSCHPASPTETRIGGVADRRPTAGPRSLQNSQALRGRSDLAVSPPTAKPSRPFGPSPTVAPPGSLLPSPSPASQVAASATSGEWRIAGPGILDVPILLYHHIDPGRPPGKFNVTPAQFELQVQSLAAGGFQSITPANLRQAVLHGAPLPARPIIITIDDGHENAYVYAYPILEKYGFDAVIYVVANRLWSTGCLSAEQLIELSEAGWEVGSHSMTHADLTTRVGRELRLEIFGSREQLEASLGQEVPSFAYPFGAFSPEVAGQVRAAGYQTAMGLGTSTLQGRGNLYYLSRIPVNGSWTVSEFAAAVGFDIRP